MPAASTSGIASPTNIPDQSQAQLHETRDEGTTRRRPCSVANWPAPRRATTASGSATLRATGTAADDLAEKQCHEEHDQDDENAVVNVPHPGHVLPGHVRERQRARVTLPNGGIVRRTRVEEEQERDGGDEHEPVHDGDEAAVEPRGEPAGRVGEEQMGEDRRIQPVDREPDRDRQPRARKHDRIRHQTGDRKRGQEDPCPAVGATLPDEDAERDRDQRD
jgi:hypothetical protein